MSALHNNVLVLLPLIMSQSASKVGGGSRRLRISDTLFTIRYYRMGCRPINYGLSTQVPYLCTIKFCTFILIAYRIAEIQHNLLMRVEYFSA